jgi:hypothetical protein
MATKHKVIFVSGGEFDGKKHGDIFLLLDCGHIKIRSYETSEMIRFASIGFGTGIKTSCYYCEHNRPPKTEAEILRILGPVALRAYRANRKEMK